MRLVPTLAAACILMPLVAAANHIRAEDATVMIAPTNDAAAVLMRLENTGTENDRLIRVEAGELARSVALHTHVKDPDGTARMVEADEGIDLPAGTSHVVGRAGNHTLGRDGDHAIFLDLAGLPEAGADIPLTLVFESGTEITLSVPVQRHPTAAAVN